VVIGTYPTEFAAAMARNAVVEAGIPCEMLGIHTAGFRAEAPGGVKLIVPAERAEEARAIVDGFRAELLKDDWDDS
jgi:hypothetical protein